jgi:hypothetical protein
VEYIYWSIPKELFFLQRICRSCFGYELCVCIYISFLFWRYFRHGGTPTTGDQPVVRSPPTQNNTNTEQRHTPMPRVGFELTISVTEKAKTIHALERAAAVIGAVVHST